ncbi:MAG TPA: FeoA family protein [Bacteroidia bacterium]|nr:FeoA family protein [Bacteroidia bacterium]HRH08815.1 FeoA family protein [Bacteroidia bacterium]HRH63809.1 FeoA family protein [Bacteroidia bacterium]
MVENLAELTEGESARILSFTDLEMSLKFLEMGCIPGEIITLERVAPFGDPIAISVAGYLLSMRKSEAATVVIKRLNASQNK